MREVEAKVRLGGRAARSAFIARLRAVGARRRGTASQVDTYFGHPIRDFASTDEALRLRSEAGRLELTYKGPKSEGRLKTRQELTVPLRSDPSALLQAIGFAPGPVVRKQRERWILGNVEIAVDDIRGLGTFVEVEAIRGGARSVLAALRRLGLAREPLEPRSYLELLMRAKKKIRRGP